MNAAVVKGARVVDTRDPGVVGVARSGIGRFSGLVRVEWLSGGLSWVHVSVLAVAKDRP